MSTTADPVPDDQPGSDQQDSSFDLRNSWREFARRKGGSFRESERHGLERFLPAAVWRPAIRLPLRGETLRIEAMRRSLLGSWHKQNTGLRDWIAPGGEQSFDYTTAISLRFRPAAPFRMAVGPSDAAESLDGMRHNFDFGSVIALGGSEPFLVHASDPALAGLVLSNTTRNELRHLAKNGAPFEVLVHQAPRGWGLGGSRTEIRVRIGALLVDHEDLDGFATVVRESFEQMRRAGLVQEAAGRGLVS